MNNVVLIGRLTKQPEQSFTKDGMEVCKFTLAVDREFKEGTDFIRVTAFAKTAEVGNRYLGKGSQTAIKGRIQTGSYKDREGKTVYTTDIIADRIEFVGGRKEREEDTGFTEDTSDIPF